MTNIEIQARKLIENLLNDCLPNKQITIPVKGEFRGLYYPSGGVRLAVKSEAVIEFLLKNKVLILHEKLPSSNNYPVKPTRFILSYDKQQAEEFLSKEQKTYTGLRLCFYPNDNGLAEYKGGSHNFRSGTKAYVLLNYLNECKDTPFSCHEIQKSCNPRIKIAEDHFKTDDDIDDTVRYIRKMLKVNKSEYFPIKQQGTGWNWVQH